jgi:hypothetical protein
VPALYALDPDPAQVLSGWPLELLTGICAAPDRAVARRLLALSSEAIDTLADDTRETLSAALQDAIQELPDF